MSDSDNKWKIRNSSDRFKEFFIFFSYRDEAEEIWLRTNNKNLL